jgi:hypothetical protein
VELVQRKIFSSKKNYDVITPNISPCQIQLFCHKISAATERYDVFQSLSIYESHFYESEAPPSLPASKSETKIEQLVQLAPKHE